MLNHKTSSTRVTQHSRLVQVKEWLTKQQDLASHLVLIVIEADGLMIHAAARGEWLASLDWSGERIVVLELQNTSSPYEFRACNSALSFLDALLLHHFTKTAETRVKNASLAALAG